MSDRKESNHVTSFSEQDQMYGAAFALSSMSYATLDINTARALQEMKETFLRKQQTKNGSEFQARESETSACQPQARSEPPQIPVDERHGYSYDRTRLPRYPPIENLRYLIGNCAVPFEKQITESDTRQSQSRISLNKQFVETYFRPLLLPSEDVVSGIPVLVYGLDGNSFSMDFKFWCYKNYVLNNGWNAFARHYNIQACTNWATIWMFRRIQDNELCFAIVLKVDPKTQTLIPTRRRC